MELTFQTFDPSTNQPLETYQRCPLPRAVKALEESWQEYQLWKHRPVTERAAAVGRWAESLKARRQEIAFTMTEEMGKPLTEALGEVDKCVFTCDYLAKHAGEWLTPKKVESGYSESWITYDPIGPVLAIMPWNFPLWQVIRFAAPALIAGNTILLKHADLTAGCAELIAESAQDLVPGLKLFRNLAMDHETAAKLIAHPKIRGVTFTGSTRGGREVALAAAGSLKKLVLELGGSDAYVVLADADLARAAKICAAGRLVNGGQSCVAAKRFIVERSVEKQFTELFVGEMRKVVAGDPKKEETKLGPMASKKFQQQLGEQVADLKAKGGEILLGGEIPAGPGAFYPSTVVRFEKPQVGLGDIEIFGPVAMVIAVDSAEEAIRVANESPFGLGGAIFTKDVERGRKLARDMEAGFVGINDQVKSDVRLPFGGVKQSGYGRELSFHGILEFCNIKTVGIGSV